MTSRSFSLSLSLALHGGIQKLRHVFQITCHPLDLDTYVCVYAYIRTRVIRARAGKHGRSIFVPRLRVHFSPSYGASKFLACTRHSSIKRCRRSQHVSGIQPRVTTLIRYCLQRGLRDNVGDPGSRLFDAITGVCLCERICTYVLVSENRDDSEHRALRRKNFEFRRSDDPEKLHSR